MSMEFSPDEEALYNKTGEGLAKRLRKTRNPGELLATVRGTYKEFDRAYASAPVEARAAVACRAGCDACCHGLVGVQAHEVLIAAEHIQKHFSPDELDGVIARTKQHGEAFAGKSNGERAALKLPCALLRDGRCAIYEARPEACRSHHSTNADACRINLEAGNEAIDVYVSGVRGRMFAVMLSMDQAVEEAGFDDQAYDFNTALHEALTDGLSASRWTQRQAAFSEASREAAE